MDESASLRSWRLQARLPTAVLPDAPHFLNPFPGRQAVRHLTVNEAIARSIRAWGANHFIGLRAASLSKYATAPDCKSGVSDTPGSNPGQSTTALLDFFVSISRGRNGSLPLRRQREMAAQLHTDVADSGQGFSLEANSSYFSASKHFITRYITISPV